MFNWTRWQFLLLQKKTFPFERQSEALVTGKRFFLNSFVNENVQIVSPDGIIEFYRDGPLWNSRADRKKNENKNPYCRNFYCKIIFFYPSKRNQSRLDGIFIGPPLFIIFIGWNAELFRQLRTSQAWNILN